MYAVKYKLPIIVHTGFSKMTTCRRFEKFIKNFKSVPVILAHGQPEVQAEKLVSTYTNCYLDTAFLSSLQISRLLESEVKAKVLLGSDYPIQYTYPDTKKLLVELGENWNVFEKTMTLLNFLEFFAHKVKINDIQTNQ